MPLEQLEFEIKTATTDDKEQILRFLRTFYFQDAPLSCYLKVLTDENPINENLEAYTSALIDDLPPLMAVYNDKLIGVCINTILERDKLSKPPPSWIDDKLMKMVNLLGFVSKGADAFGKHAGCVRALSAAMLSVDQTYRGNGVAKKLLEKSWELGKQHGCGFMVVDCSSHFTARALKSLGFELIYSMDYADYEVNGEVVFKPPPPHKAFTVYTKIIQ
ncbi:unnamed protein product [Phaedon cochleariae]|uniref:aralkylamine N-acetyltransferase n=1 Tax=Phaedon cochleariae TaxID=80249 RepID=A0A9P0GIG8_PHACE|nr:unnamed protein product [Phaedon cochleariae]